MTAKSNKKLKTAPAGFDASRIGPAAYDGRLFYAEVGGKWMPLNASEFHKHLRILGFSSQRPKGKTFSECDAAECWVMQNARVELAASVVHFPAGIFGWAGKNYLNLGSVKPLAPVPSVPGRSVSWEDGRLVFPFIHRFMETALDRGAQLPCLLAWIKSFYEAGVSSKPVVGQAVVLSGPAGSGKTLLTEGIFATLMGGAKHVDSGAGLVYWRRDVLASPLLICSEPLVDTTLPSVAIRATMESHRLEEKGMPEAMLPWYGRMVVEVEALEELPEGLLRGERVSQFDLNGSLVAFPDREEIARALKAELPWFARFLLDWSTPSELLPADGRFPLQAHVFKAAPAPAPKAQLEVLAEYLRGFAQHLADWTPASHPTKSWWGSTQDLYLALSLTFEEFQADFPSALGFGAFLGQVFDRKLAGLGFSRDEGGQRWTLPHSAG